MNSTARYTDEMRTEAGTIGTTTVAAVFADRESAHDTVHQLHDEGFRDTWIGITRRDDVEEYTPPISDVAPENYVARADYVAPEDAKAPNDNTSRFDASESDRTCVESDNWFMRFFGEGDESLHDALVRHGVSEADARNAGSFPAHSAILTVDGSNHPELAAQIMSRSGGQLITRNFGSAPYGDGAAYGTPMGGSETAATPDRMTRTDRAAAPDSAERLMSPNEVELERKYAPAAGTTPDPEFATSAYATDSSLAEPDVRAYHTTDATQPPKRSADPTSYDDFGDYRAGEPLDESTRLQLREERLRVDRSRAAGLGPAGTDVVTENRSDGGPFTREDLFTERRPVSDSTLRRGL
jgi:hypothetical protein